MLFVPRWHFDWRELNGIMSQSSPPNPPPPQPLTQRYLSSFLKEKLELINK